MLPGIDSILHFCPECGQRGGDPKTRNFGGRHSWMEAPYANVQLSEASGRALTDRQTDQGPTARPSAMRDALFEIARGMDLLRSRRNLGLEETRLHFPSTQNMPK